MTDVVTAAYGHPLAFPTLTGNHVGFLCETTGLYERGREGLN